MFPGREGEAALSEQQDPNRTVRPDSEADADATLLKGAIEAARRQNRRNRGIILIFVVLALVFVVSPPVIRWWMQQGICPAEVTAKGRNSGTDWEVTRSDCGATVGTVWQVRIVPTAGASWAVYDARGGPVPLAYEQSGFTGTVTLQTPPKGATETTIPIELDMKGRPKKTVRFVDGVRQD